MSWYNPNGVTPGSGWGGSPGNSFGAQNPQTDPGLMQRLMHMLGNPSMSNLMSASNQMFQAGAPRMLPPGATGVQGGGGQMGQQMAQQPSTLGAMAQMGNALNNPLGQQQGQSQVTPLQLQQLMQALQQFRQGS